MAMLISLRLAKIVFFQFGIRICLQISLSRLAVQFWSIIFIPGNLPASIPVKEINSERVYVEKIFRKTLQLPRY
jgi:hypothetical protein